MTGSDKSALLPKRKVAWVLQSIEHPTLGFGSGHELTVRGIEPHMGLHAVSTGPVWDSLCPSLGLSVSLSLSLCLSLKINKCTLKKKKRLNCVFSLTHFLEAQIIERTFFMNAV